MEGNVKRPFLLAFMALVHGELLVLIEQEYFIIFLGALFFSLIIAYKIIYGENRSIVILYVIFFIIGFLKLSDYDHAFNSMADKDEIIIEGVVLSERNNIFIKAYKGEYNGSVFKVVTKNKNFKTGDKVSISGSCIQMKESNNDGSFNEKIYYYSTGVIGIIESEKIELLIKSREETLGFINSLREKLENNIDKVTDETIGGIFKTIVFGDDTNIDMGIKKSFQDAGISHILSISGLHISIVGVFVFFVLKRRLKYINATVISFIIMVLYGIMTGGSISTIRAIIMFTISIVGRTSGRVYDIKNAIGISGVLILLKNPYYLFNTGFILSFVAVLGIGFFYPVLIKIFNIKNKIIAMIMFSTSITIFLIPLNGYFFYQIPGYSILLNIILVPLMGIIIISGMISSLLCYVSYDIAYFFIGSGSYVIRLYIFICDKVGDLPFSTVVVGKLNIGRILIYYSIIIIIIYLWEKNEKKLNRNNKIEDGEKSKISKKYFKILFVTVLLFVVIFFRLDNKSKIAFLDVGQGECSIILGKDKKIYMFDCGSSSVNNIGEKVVIPWIKYNGHSKIDYLILSHNDSDHINGVINILEDKTISIDNIIINYSTHWEEMIRIFKLYNINIIKIKRGDEIKSDGITIKFLNPYILKDNDVNKDSIVSLVYTKNSKILFTGDIDKEIEKNLIKEGCLEEVDILKVPHHGSEGSSSKEFINYIKPKYVFISCGKNNIYGHPSKRVIMDYKEITNDIYISYDTGQLNIY